MHRHPYNGAAAPGLALPIAPLLIDEAPGGTAEGSRGHQETELPDCADSDERRKAITKMMARAAMCGCTLHELASGGFLLCRWGLTRELPCLRAVGELLRRIGGAR